MNARQTADTLRQLLAMVADSTNDRRQAGLVDMESVMDTFDDLCVDDYNGAEVSKVVTSETFHEDAGSFRAKMANGDVFEVIVHKSSSEEQVAPPTPDVKMLYLEVRCAVHNKPVYIEATQVLDGSDIVHQVESDVCSGTQVDSEMNVVGQVCEPSNWTGSFVLR